MIGNPDFTATDFKQLATHRGQAHFAVDSSHTCRECASWANQKGERNRKRLLRSGLCLKAGELMAGLPPVPHSAWACRHFTPAQAPPPI
jgi:hypothetical protein